MFTRYEYMSTVVVFVIFAQFSEYIFVRALLAETPNGWAHFEPCGACRQGLGAIRAVCRAWQAFEDFLPAGVDKTNLRGFS